MKNYRILDMEHVYAEVYKIFGLKGICFMLHIFDNKAVENIGVLKKEYCCFTESTVILPLAEHIQNSNANRKFQQIASLCTTYPRIYISQKDMLFLEGKMINMLRSARINPKIFVFTLIHG